jgi:hypothetical protein
MRSATIRFAIAVVLGIVGYNVARIAVDFEWRARIVGIFGIDIEKPTRCFCKDTPTGRACLNWCHDYFIPSFWGYLFFWLGLVVALLAAGAIASRGVPARPVLPPLSGAVIGLCICIDGYWIRGESPSDLLGILLPAIAMESYLLVIGGAVIGYLGGRIARTVA